MNDLYKLLSGIGGLSVFDTLLLLLIFYLVRGKIQGLLGDLKCARERITRLERAIIASGVNLGDIEEE